MKDVMIYAAICLAVFAVLTFLKFCEDSPIRSWKSVLFTGVPLAFIVCYYVSCAFPTPPPQARAEKVAANKAELERTFRRIEGVSHARIDEPVIELNFAYDKPLQELKQIARQTGGTAAHFLKLDKTNQITVRISIRGRNRYEMEYDTERGVISEHEF
jgi:hypothetical protein